MTRSKAPIIQEMTEALEQFESLLLDYLDDLESEMEEVQKGDNYRPLVRSLIRQIDMLRAVHLFIEEDLLHQMLTIANMSQSLSHKRTRRFF
jgi:hypothetical protein